MSLADASRLGIRCAFNSDSFAAYRTSALLGVGGFQASADIGEDTVAAATSAASGRLEVAYASDAKVFHSHRLSILQEAARYVAIGRMHSVHEEVFSRFGRAEGAGWEYVRSELAVLGERQSLADPRCCAPFGSEVCRVQDRAEARKSR